MAYGDGTLISNYLIYLFFFMKKIMEKRESGVGNVGTRGIGGEIKKRAIVQC